MASQATSLGLNISPLALDIASKEWTSCCFCEKEDSSYFGGNIPCGAKEDSTPQMHLNCALARMAFGLILASGDHIASVTYGDKKHTQGMQLPYFFTLTKGVIRLAPDEASRKKLNILWSIKHKRLFTELNKEASNASLTETAFKNLILEKLGKINIDLDHFRLAANP